VELSWSFVWLREAITNEPLVSGQQLFAPSEEESSGRAIVSALSSELDFANSLRNER
jgi:hypothetical protein